VDVAPDISDTKMRPAGHIVNIGFERTDFGQTRLTRVTGRTDKEGGRRKIMTAMRAVIGR